MKNMALAQSLQTALEKPTVYSPKVETVRRWDALRAEYIFEVLYVLAGYKSNSMIY
jgi:hypothetical protein